MGGRDGSHVVSRACRTMSRACRGHVRSRACRGHVAPCRRIHFSWITHLDTLWCTLIDYWPPGVIPTANPIRQHPDNPTTVPTIRQQFRHSDIPTQVDERSHTDEACPSKERVRQTPDKCPTTPDIRRSDNARQMPDKCPTIRQSVPSDNPTHTIPTRRRAQKN